jgi:glycosyltransferase involved in cell wall biosynthesis
MNSSQIRITVTIITLNEEKKLKRCLESVKWADEIVVVDSGSTDRTLEVARNAGALVFTNPWPGYGPQKNFAHQKARGKWVLNIDADEVVTESLRDEILSRITDNSGVIAYRVPRKTWYLGRWILHGGWYPNHLVRLALREKSRWTEPALHEQLLTLDPAAEVETLSGELLHYSFDSITDQVGTNLRYAREGAAVLTERKKEFSYPLLIFKPVGKFFETYLLKKGFLDGMAGFIISVNAAHSMFLKYAFLYEDKERTNENSHYR